MVVCKKVTKKIYQNYQPSYTMASYTKVPRYSRVGTC